MKVNRQSYFDAKVTLIVDGEPIRLHSITEIKYAPREFPGAARPIVEFAPNEPPRDRELSRRVARRILGDIGE